jgi:cell division protein FtsB
MSRRRSKQEGLSIRSKFLIGAVAFLFLVLMIASFFGDKGLIETYQVGNQTKALEEQVNELRRQRDALRREIKELNQYPGAVREKARELGLGRPDETVILK